MSWQRHAGTLALAGWVALGLLGACEEAAEPGPQVVQQRVALQSFPDCAALERHIEDVAVREMKANFSTNGIAVRGGVGFFDDVAMDGALPSQATAEGSGAEASTPSAFTTTNNQVAGVNEADFVKNDGTRILVLSGRTLYATRSWPPQQLALVGKLEIEGRPQQMLLEPDADRVAVFSSVDGGYGGYEDGPRPLPVDGGGAEPALADACFDCGYYGGAATTKVTVVDIATLDDPKVVEEVYLPGSYVDARRVGSTVRLVLRDDVRWPTDLRYYVEGPVMLDGVGSMLTSESAALEEANERLIRERSLDDWLPQAQRKLSDGSTIDLDYRCEDFHASEAPVRLGLTTIATFDLTNPEALARTSIVEAPDMIYASAASLYVTARHWWWSEEAGQSDHTYLHKFDTSESDRAVYVASGSVEGHIVNSFAMDEHEGALRIATTIDSRVADAEMPWRMESVNRVSVLGEKAGALEVIGRTPDIAPTERIQSARFVGDKGFVVTFRQVDPLYTLDLSDPTTPTIVGELKVPGFSTYIHPLDDDHLLTIGIHVPDPEDPRAGRGERHLKLTIFDVGDFANPKEKFTEPVGSSSAWSEATQEHKAFNYFADKKLLAIPFNDHAVAWRGPEQYWERFVSDVRVFDIDVDEGISLRGALSMGDVYEEGGRLDWAWYYNPWVRRSVMASDEGGSDYVYAISDAGIRVADIAALGSPLETVAFTPGVDAP